jgi:hypothetical protein
MYLEVGLEAVRGGGTAAGAGPGRLLAHHAEVYAVQVRQHLLTETSPLVLGITSINLFRIATV